MSFQQETLANTDKRGFHRIARIFSFYVADAEVAGNFDAALQKHDDLATTCKWKRT
jgi:hypothetical protein